MSLETSQGNLWTNFWGIDKNNNLAEIREEQDKLYNDNNTIISDLQSFYNNFNNDREQATRDLLGDQYDQSVSNTRDSMKQATNQSLASIKQNGGSGSSLALSGEIKGTAQENDTVNNTRYGLQDQALSQQTQQSNSIFNMNNSQLNELGNRNSAESQRKSGLSQVMDYSTDIAKTFASLF